MAHNDRSRTRRLTNFLLGQTGTQDRSAADATQPIPHRAGADTVPLDDAWVDPAPDAIPNLDKRALLMLVVDTSHSMGQSVTQENCLSPISQLNAGLQLLRQTLMDDGDARRRVEVGMLTFGGTPELRNLRQGTGFTSEADQAFVSADQFAPPHLAAGGLTPMAAALRQALTIVEARKSTLKDRHIPYYRPWIMLISDGAPTDGEPEWAQAVREMHQAQQARKAVIFPIGVEHADMKRLEDLIWNDPDDPESHYHAMKLQGLRFSDLFLWLSASIKDTLTSSRDNPRTAMSRRGRWAQMDVS